MLKETIRQNLTAAMLRKKEGEENKSSSSPKLASAKLKKENEVLFASTAARVGEEDKFSSSPFAAARVIDIL